MGQSTRRFFNSDFIIKNKLSFSAVILLQDIYFWILGKNPPKSIEIEDVTFYYISQTHFAELNYGLLNQQRISTIFKELKEAGIVGESILVERHMNYMSFNWDKIKESVLSEGELKNMESNEWWKRIHEYADEQIAKKDNVGKNPDDLLNQGYEIVVKNGRKYLVKKKGFQKSYNKDSEDKMLLSEEDMGLKQRICKEADSIARLILKRYGNYFSHRIPEEGKAPTKTYIGICKKITDIYNGSFCKSRIYPFGEKFLNNKQFNIAGWKDKIKEVQGDWVKVKKLILSALKNFVLMHNEDRMPYSKDYLQYNLNLWFYDRVSNYDEPQSQFVFCLFEPDFTAKHNSELKADKIFETLSDTAKEGGNELFELNKNMPSGLFWQRVKEMVEWGDMAFENEPNIQYWFSSSSELPGLFAKYCIEKKISVSVNTLDIKKAVENNSPWSWFVKDSSLKHGLNIHLSECVSKNDFLDCYRKEFENDDMEIPIF